jgi:acetylornithine deacetylase/succinyl-diaminopimelate desuccinylase-like protein
VARTAFPVDLAERMIATKSVSAGGTLALARLCREEVLVRTDLDSSLCDGDAPGQVNLVATKGLGTAPAILLNSHLDTVPPGDPELWSECGGDPFAATRKGNRLFGLGSADAKLDWLCKALALARFRGRRFSRGVIFAGTFGEEIGLRGARALLRKLPEKPVAAWAGEPTELGLVTSHKGLLVVAITAGARRPTPSAATTSLTIRGRAAHSSTPELGENAIVRALGTLREQNLRVAAIHGGDAANKVPALCNLDVAGSGERRARLLPEELTEFVFALADEGDRITSSLGREDPSFSPPRATWNFGRLDGEGDSMRAVLDFRCLPGDEASHVLRELEAFLSRARRERRIEAALAVERNNPPLHTAEDSPAVAWSLAVLAELGLSTETYTKAGCTEAGVYAAGGIPSVVFGPGRSAGNIHAPNESVPIPELERAVEFYSRLVDRFCLA